MGQAFRYGSLLLAVAVAACAPAPTKQTELLKRQSAPIAPKGAGVIGNHGGNLVGGNTSSLLANNAGSFAGVVRGPASGLIANNAAGILANNAGGLVANNAAGYRVRAIADHTEPVPNAQVVVLDETGAQISTGTAVTDRAGRFRCPGLKASGPLLFIRATYLKEGRPITLISAAAAPREPGVIELDVDPATTLVAKKLGEMVRLNVASVATLKPDTIPALIREVSPAMTAKAVVAAAILDPARAAKTFDAMVLESKPLAESLTIAAAGTGSPQVTAPTPAKPQPAPPAPAATQAPVQNPDTPPTTGTTPAETPTEPPAPVDHESGTGGGPTPAPIEIGEDEPIPVPTPAPTATPIPATPAPTAVPTATPPGATPTPRPSTTPSPTASPSSTPKPSTPKPSSTPTATPTPAGGVRLGTLETLELITGSASDLSAPFRTDTVYAPEADIVVETYKALDLEGNERQQNYRITGAPATRAIAFDGSKAFYLTNNQIYSSSHDRFIHPALYEVKDFVVRGDEAYATSVSAHCLYTINLRTGTLAVLAGTEGQSGYADGAGTAAKFYQPTGLALVGDALYVADQFNHRIRKVTLAGTVSTVAGSAPGFADGTGASVKFNFPTDVTADDRGILYVADLDNHRVRRLTPTGEVKTIAGTGLDDSQDGVGAEGTLSSPGSIAWGRVSGESVLFVGEYYENRIRLLHGWE